MENRELIIADCTYSSKPVELYSVEKEKHKLVLANESIVDDVKTSLEQSTAWLPFFAELYNTSPKLEDYLMVPCIICPSCIPNKNAQAFPFEELIKVDVETGHIGYETWARKPTFLDHVNKDHTKAKGIIFSSAIKPIKGAKGNLHKVVALLGFCRKTDPIIANDILTGAKSAYSLGAWSRYFTCSVCGSKHTSQNQGCEHISLKQPRMKMFDNKLAYLQARNISGFETSVLNNAPAYESARTPKSMLL